MKVLILLLSITMTSFAFSANNNPLPTVKNVDLDRYIGKWYEIARFDQKFQKGCTSVEAIYTKRKDGDIGVQNKCRLNSPNGTKKSAYGRAWVTNKHTNAKLKVQFFLSRFRIPFLAGNYWILDLDKDYKYALIGDPSRKYLWILSRTNTLDERTYNYLVEKARDLNFDTSKLLKTIH